MKPKIMEGSLFVLPSFFLCILLILINSTSHAVVQPDSVILSTFIEGHINGVDFTGTGTGIGYPNEGRVRGTITFDRFPADYTPLLCRTWKCKHHPNLAREISRGMNFFTLTAGACDYDVFSTITYPWGDTLYVTAQVRRPDPYHQTVHQVRTGHYTGPTDVVSILPFQDIIHPAGRGKITVEGSRSVVRSDSSIITYTWREEVFFLDTTVTMPFDQIVSYTPITTRWDPQNLELELETIVTIRPVGVIPTLTEWGMIIFGVVLLGFITWVFLRRRKAAVSLR